MTKLVVAFRNFAMAPKTERCLHFEPDDLYAAAFRAVGGLAQKCNINLCNY
jgi:hypothetical protein